MMYLTSLVPAPSHGDEGSGTMRVPNLFCCAKILITNQILSSPQPRQKVSMLVAIPNCRSRVQKRKPDVVIST